VNATLLNGLGIDERFARKATAVSTYLNDALDSPVALVKSGGTTRYIYAPFGAASAFGTSSSNAYQFTGRENDGTPGLCRRLTLNARRRLAIWPRVADSPLNARRRLLCSLRLRLRWCAPCAGSAALH
jgi:hypothetical protein